MLEQVKDFWVEDRLTDTSWVWSWSNQLHDVDVTSSQLVVLIRKFLMLRVLIGHIAGSGVLIQGKALLLLILEDLLIQKLEHKGDQDNMVQVDPS